MGSVDFKSKATVYREDELTRNRYYGIWRGKVEYNQDPLQRGRIKVRINEIYGEFEGGEVSPTNWWMPTEDLPWAEVIHPFGGGYDYGSYMIPEVGSTCFVVFEKADPNYPMVLGYWFSSPEYEQKMGYNQDESQPGQWLPKSMGVWYGKNAPEPPLESQGIRNFEPTRRVLYKSPKGHVIYIDDRDEAEFLEILDRTGQGLRLEGFVTEEYNNENRDQRHYRSVFRRDQIDRRHLKDGRSRIILKGLSGSLVEMDSKPGRERILILGRSGENIDDSANDQIIEIFPYRGKIIIESSKDGYKRCSISIDALTGGVELRSSDHVTLISPDVFIDGNLHVSGKTDIGGDINIGGTNTSARFVGQNK